MKAKRKKREGKRGEGGDEEEEERWKERWRSGDGPNDRELLEAADVAVAIPNPHAAVPLQCDKTWIRADAPGPTGWSSALIGILGGDTESRRD